MKILRQLGVEGFRLRMLRGLEDLLGLEYQHVAGVDEVGRGCLAGPVVAAAVIPRSTIDVPGVDDSKLVDPERRALLADQIQRTAIAWAVEAIAPDEIDRLNILQATKLAMTRAIDSLAPRPDAVIVDAVRLSPRDYRCVSLVRGDVVSYAVACASILAKVRRDELMRDLDRQYPVYGFARNKGYGAPEHRKALEEFGPCPEHRLTFRSVLPRSAGTVH